tara:strand:+ start:444 stop:704 length:261 start_codon:yes stop_codon:yes gene_type:complete
MDDPNDFNEYNPHFAVGDLVEFVGYHYSPDYKYIDEDDYKFGLVMKVKKNIFYQPVYTVYWFKNGRTTEVLGDHLSLVVKQIKNYL